MSTTDINLYDYLDEVYKSPFNKSAMESIFNKFVSAPNLFHQHGTVWNGKQTGTPTGTIVEPTAERQAYQLQPTVTTQNGSDMVYRVYRDYLIKAEALGIDVSQRIPEWGSALKFNYVPPIDLDKLANYSDYYWYDVDNPGSTPQYITVENLCVKASGVVDQYQIVLNTRGSSIAVQYIDIANNTITINNNFADIFINGFVFFIDNSLNVDINNRYWTTTSSQYLSGTNTTVITVLEPITQQYPMESTINLAPLLTVFEARRNCKCYGSVGWDYAQWDDNQVGSLIWNTNLMLQITSDTEPTNPIQYQLWYNPTLDILYQYNSGWNPVQNAFSLILSQTSGTHDWDLDTNCDVLTNSWTVNNNWLHINEVPNFEIAQRAQLPILEYSIFTQLNNWVFTSINWFYRSTIYTPFSNSNSVPSLFELVPNIQCTFVSSNTILLSPSVYDLTRTFVPGYQFNINGTVVSVQNSEYIYTNNTLLQTQIVFQGMSLTSTDNIAISPIITSIGDKWEGYNRHWVFQGANDPVPCNTQEQNIYQTEFNVKTYVSSDSTYLYSLNSFGEQFTVVKPNPTATYTLDSSIQQIALYGTNSTRVYINGNRIYAAYNEIPIAPTTQGMPTYVGGIQFDNVITIKPYDIITVYVGPDAQVDLGYSNISVRTILSDTQYQSIGNVYVSAIQYKIVDQIVTQSNQYPLFDIFDVDSTPLNEVSSIFKYATSDSEPINQYIGERIIASSAPTNFTFEQTLLLENNGPLKSYRLIPQGGTLNYFWYNPSSNLVQIWNGTCWVTKLDIPDVGYVAPIVSTIVPETSGYTNNPYYYCTSNNQGYVYNNYVDKWIESTYTYVGENDPTLTTIWRPGLTLEEFIPQYVDANRNPISVSNPDGSWEIPHQMMYNPMHQNLTTITYMDLYDHCTSIVSAQPSVPGLSSQVNTYYATASNKIDFGLGGTIREYNGSYDTFISSLNINQQINIKSVIQFAEVQYQFLYDMFNQSFIKQLPAILTSVNNNLYTDMQTYAIQQILSGYEESSFINDIYFDSTAYDPTTGMGMKNWIATLPIFGFAPPVIPYIINDPYTNVQQLVCHDGHRYNLGMSYQTLNDICSNIINTPDTRTSPTTPMGIKSIVAPPSTITEFNSSFGISTPVSGKWWYQITNTSLNLYFFNVPIVGNSYTNYQPVGYPEGTLWLDTTTNTLRVNNGISWEPVTVVGDGIITAGWEQISIENFLNSSLLSIEQNLYNISQQTQVFTQQDYIKTTSNQATFFQYMINSFLEFARNTNTYEYNTNVDYSSTNPFTWNYTNSTIVEYPQVNATPVSSIGCWQNLYQQLYGTPYPHLEPWKLQGFINIPSWWMSTYSNPTSARMWIPEMWTNIMNGVLPAGVEVDFNVPTYNYISVNTTNNTVGNYPPDSLVPPYFVPVNGVTSVYTNYSQILNPSSNYTFYNPSPIFWAWTQTIDFGYSQLFNAYLMQPVRIMHLIWGNKFIECNHLEVDARTKVVFAHQNTVFHGDMISDTTTYASSGINQWYVDYLRFYSYDLNTTDLVDYWINWDMTLGYQTSGLVDPSTVTAYSPFISITSDDYTIDYKKTDNLISISASSINLIANHVPPAYITYNNQNEWTFTITTPSTNLPGPLPYYGVQNYPINLSLQNNSLLIPYMFNVPYLDATNNSLQVKTDVTSYAASGSTILLGNLTNANGFYTISSATYNPLTGLTSIVVSQPFNLPIGSLDYSASSGIVVFVSIPLPFATGDVVYISSTKELPPPLQTNYPYIYVKRTFNGFALALNQADAVAEKFISIPPTPTMGQLTVGKSAGQFTALNGATTPIVWNHFAIDTNVMNYAMPPFTINGVQNLINFFDGYRYVLENDLGIITTDTTVDSNTGFVNGWQNEIEKAINWAYSLQNANRFNLDMYPVTYIGNNQFQFTDQFVPSIPVGNTICFSTQQQVPQPLVDGVPYYIVMTGTHTFSVAYTYLNALSNTFIEITSNTTTPLYVYEYTQPNSSLNIYEVNPYKTSIGISSQFGIMAPLLETTNVNIQVLQGITDQYGNNIGASLLNVLRNDSGVEISMRDQYPSVHIGTINALFDGYEHMIVFNDQTTMGNLIYNPYLGLTISNILLDFYRSTEANFKPDMGGYFIFNKQLVRNMEATTTSMRDYFATFRLSESNVATELARQMIGFNGDFDFMTQFDVPTPSQFEFWKGLLHNKGTEASVAAFLNSNEFTDGYIDEYWAIKVAEYGDSHKNVGIKILLQSSDSEYSDLPFKFTTDIVQPNTNFINITPTDQTRWYDYPRIAQVLTKDFNEYKLLQ